MSVLDIASLLASWAHQLVPSASERDLAGRALIDTVAAALVGLREPASGWNRERLVQGQSPTVRPMSGGGGPVSTAVQLEGDIDDQWLADTVVTITQLAEELERSTFAAALRVVPVGWWESRPGTAVASAELRTVAAAI
jgi:hypothetical protein